MITLAVLWNSLQCYDDVWIVFGDSAWAFAAMFAFSVLPERHVGVTLIFQVSLSTLLYIDSRLSNTQLSHQQHFNQHNYGRNFGFFVENAFSAPVRKLILILRPLWGKKYKFLNVNFEKNNSEPNEVHFGQICTCTLSIYKSLRLMYTLLMKNKFQIVINLDLEKSDAIPSFTDEPCRLDDIFPTKIVDNKPTKFNERYSQHNQQQQMNIWIRFILSINMFIHVVHL
ncbi:hypothetical protein T4D_4367 [Trichinella pseudospiralis]|uniref:Uncharacterized protein n=1 Tax=Trichinella pseudospiralis TaxID=6337 RepID=A0A0V1G4F2_TRIPS|nr:hypothetical protein T4D_4367 [Trichinella pseudospiralis]